MFGMAFEYSIGMSAVFNEYSDFFSDKGFAEPVRFFFYQIIENTATFFFQGVFDIVFKLVRFRPGAW